MVDVTAGSNGGKWVCPNDRQLALRAKLSTGWSVKTHDLQKYGRKSQSLNEMEQNAIKQVIQRAEILEEREQERVGRLVDRLDNMKRNIMGNGTTQCILCGDTFRLFGSSNFLCCGCKKLVCEKCGIEILSSTQEPLWLCKICSETREMWKKSGAWFFKGLPKYKLPEKKSDKYGIRKIARPATASGDRNVWPKNSTDASDVGSIIDFAEEKDSQAKCERRQSSGKTARIPDASSGNSSVRLTTPSGQTHKNHGICLPSKSGNTNEISRMESERQRLTEADKKVGSEREIFRRGGNGDSFESTCAASFGRQESSPYAEPHPIQASQTSYLSSVNQSHDRLPISSEKNKPDSISMSNNDKSLTSNRSSSSKHLGGFEKFGGAFSKSPHDEDKFPPFERDFSTESSGKRERDSGGKSIASSSQSDFPAVDLANSQKNRKKVSIDFGRATSFLRYPLKGEKKRDKNKLNRFSSSESQLESSASDNGSVRISGKLESSDEFFSETGSFQAETQSVLGANHWMSQESSIHTLDSLSDLNLQHRWSRRESLSSLSRDYWSEDQVSLSSSLGTNQDDMAMTIGGKNAQLGLLEISLWYDPTRSTLHCTLHRGRGLKSTDINGLADPFCKLNILPSSGKSARLKTKTVHKTVNPEFNETVNFYGIAETDIQKKTLHILVLDDDKYGNDFLGEARIPLYRVGAKQTKHISVFLEKRYQTEDDSEIWGEDNWNRGKILVTLCYSTKKRALIVLIGRCTNLLPMDNNSLSDPFVKLHLYPDPNHKKYKTSIKWKNLNPVFNEEFVFETKMTDLPKQTLILSVWDKDFGKSNDYLGGLELGWKSKGERLKHWIDVIKFPDHKHEGWHRLGENLITD